MINYSSEYWYDVKEAISCIPNLKKLFHHSVLITGATGMIGSSIVEILFYLNRYQGSDIQVFLAGRNKERMEKRFYKWKNGKDYIFIPFEATKCVVEDVHADFIIHGASPADPISYSKKPVETMLANIFGLKSMLELFRKNHSKRVLYISSSEVYGKNNTKDSYAELDYGYVDLLNPRSCYPSAKRAAETLCAAYQKEYGVDFVIARPGHIYGPSITETDSRVSAQFTRKAAAGENIIMKSDGSQLRSYCYTLDCASAILAILLNGKNGEAYNISNKDSIITIRELAEIFAQQAEVHIQFANASDAEKKSYNLMNNSSLTSNKLESLGWTGKFGIQDGVRKTLYFYRSFYNA
ncbi:NAD-dependent epimerase/dehydratase family protein [Megasphaera elsdenii]|uniref:NAD-dependent epimerase/dehydratase family protein n=1 Tax=Megasphaera elsdenii TaxID=907 RepID=UPI0039F56DEB